MKALIADSIASDVPQTAFAFDGDIVMKTDRLYAITVYLLNHGKSSAKELARRFEVSVRTIQRDIDALCRAGIPVIAEMGADGGYSLSESFKMDSHTVTHDDYSYILTALKGFASAINDQKINETVEKIATFVHHQNKGIILDFSSLQEGDNQLFQTLQEAVQSKHPVRFEYTNAENISRIHTVEPIAVVYRWYAWYLLAYSTVKCDYRTYKLIRMRNAEIVHATFTKEHKSAEEIIKDNDRISTYNFTEITIRCHAEARAKAIEYLNGRIIGEHENGDCDMILRVIEKEQVWFGTLLSLGDTVEVLSPEHIRARLLKAARKIISLYEKI